ncbi:hypothetical protein Taro_045510 [Colocasia esculenta]|uniref:Uncharacterized protein n=1 Tax=Colocasia esculenta TaxID=4460 RepID=A0A843WWR8_COLES|nr:hypothetical protein [Colocasia esculenta]
MFYPIPSFNFDVPFFCETSSHNFLRPSLHYANPPHTLALAYSPFRQYDLQAPFRSFVVGRVASFLKLPRLKHLAVRNNQDLSKLLSSVRSLLESLHMQVESNENLELDESIKHGEQITDVDTDTFSIICSSSSITPLKRSIPGNDRGEDLSVDTVHAQHSCSKMKKIKIEKEDV